MTQYGNAFQRAANRPLRFTANWRTTDGEQLQVSGIIANVAGGRIWITRDATATLPGGKPAQHTPPTISGSSLGDLQDKLERTFSRVVISRDRDPLKIEMEHDQRQRNRSSAHAERTVSQQPVVQQESPKVFGLAPDDKENLAKLFNQAFRSWAFEHKDLEEYSDRNKTPEQIAQAQANLRQNVASMSELIFHWARTGHLKVLDASALDEAEAFLKQRHHWFVQRKRGEPMATPFTPPEPAAPKLMQKSARSMSFEELRQIERARQRRVLREKGLHYSNNGLGDVR